jgi:cytoskeletal protein CcmA (bactofilin family)
LGSSGVVEGDLNGNQADVVGKVSGNIRAKELLQLRGDAVVNGNLYAGKLQIEPTATFNGQCHMGANIVDMSNSNEQQAVHK